MQCCYYEREQLERADSMFNVLKSQERIADELYYQVRAFQHTQEQLFAILTDATHVQIRNPEDLRIAICKLKRKFADQNRPAQTTESKKASE